MEKHHFLAGLLPFRLAVLLWPSVYASAAEGSSLSSELDPSSSSSDRSMCTRASMRSKRSCSSACLLAFPAASHSNSSMASRSALAFFLRSRRASDFADTKEWRRTDTMSGSSDRLTCVQLPGPSPTCHPPPTSPLRVVAHVMWSAPSTRVSSTGPASTRARAPNGPRGRPPKTDVSIWGRWWATLTFWHRPPHASAPVWVRATLGREGVIAMATSTTYFSRQRVCALLCVAGSAEFVTIFARFSIN